MAICTHSQEDKIKIWDGYLFDCDFNQAINLYMGGNKKHISDLKSLPGPHDSIAVAEHCYTCTAGSGFT